MTAIIQNGICFKCNVHHLSCACYNNEYNTNTIVPMPKVKPPKSEHNNTLDKVVEMLSDQVYYTKIIAYIKDNSG